MADDQRQRFGSMMSELYQVAQGPGYTPEQRLDLLAHPSPQPGGVADGEWSNWAQSQRSTPASISKPTTLPGLQQAVREAVAAGHKVRAIGFSGAWAPLVTSNQAMIDMGGLTQVLGLDPITKQIRVEAGISLAAMEVELYRARLCLPTSSVIPYPQVGGALATGVHGTGRAQGMICDSVVELQVVMATGAVRSFSPKDAEWPALLCSLGTIGIVYAATFQAVDLFRLAVQDDTRTRLVRQVMRDPAEVKAILDGHDYVEIFWWPTTDYVWLKTWDITQAPVTKTAARYIMDEIVLSLETQFTRVLPKALVDRPWLTPMVMEALSWLVPKQNYVADAPIAYHYQVAYPPIWDMCYAIEVNGDFQRVCDAFMFVVDAVDAARAKGLYPQNQVLHLRYLHGSKALLSPVHGTGGYILIEILHFKPSENWQEHAGAVEAFWIKMGGRPHWGKCASWGRSYPHPTWRNDVLTKIPAMYGKRWTQFKEIRDRLDPEHVFTNPYLDDLLK